MTYEGRDVTMFVNQRTEHDMKNEQVKKKDIKLNTQSKTE